MEKRFYILTYLAEEVGYSIVELTEEEAITFRNLLKQPFDYGGGYCGGAWLSNDSWTSKDSAMDIILEEAHYE